MSGSHTSPGSASLAVSVALLPRDLPTAGLAGSAAVVIDNFRASTVIVTALAAGASCVLPRRDMDSARELRRRLPEALLGGERGGVRPMGFDLGNSPREYTPSRVAGRTVILTTTNGTAALQAAAAAGASPLLMAGLVNVSATAAALAAAARPIVIVCAGTEGRVSLEDAVAAGALLDRLLTEPVADGRPRQLDDVAQLCLAAYQGCRGRLLETLSAALGGRNVTALGLGDDLPICVAEDAHSLVAEAEREPTSPTAELTLRLLARVNPPSLRA